MSIETKAALEACENDLENELNAVFGNADDIPSETSDTVTESAAYTEKVSDTVISESTEPAEAETIRRVGDDSTIVYEAEANPAAAEKTAATVEITEIPAAIVAAADKMFPELPLKYDLAPGIIVKQGLVKCELTRAEFITWAVEVCKISMQDAEAVADFAGHDGYYYRDLRTLLEVIARMAYTAKIPRMVLIGKYFTPQPLVLYNFIRKKCSVCSHKQVITDTDITPAVERGIPLCLVNTIIKLRASITKDATKTDFKKRKITENPSTDFIHDILHIFGHDPKKSIFNQSVYLGNLAIDKTLLRVVGATLDAMGMPYDVNSGVELKNQFIAMADPYEWHPKADFFRKIRESIPYCAGDPDYIGELFEKCFQDDDHVFEASFREWIHNEVATALNGKRERQQIVILLMAAKGDGKSSWVKWLFSCLPTGAGDIPIFTTDHECYEMSGIFRDKHVDFTRSDTAYDTAAARCAYLAVELSELKITPKCENAFKACVTDLHPDAIEKWETAATRFRPLSMMIGTCDQLSLSRPDMHRLRVVHYATKPGKKFAYEELDPRKIWAQAVWEVTHGKIYTPDAAMKDIMENAQLSSITLTSSQVFLDMAYELAPDVASGLRTADKSQWAVSLYDINRTLAQAEGVDSVGKYDTTQYFLDKYGKYGVKLSRTKCYDSCSGEKRQVKGYRGLRPSYWLCQKMQAIHPADEFYRDGRNCNSDLR